MENASGTITLLSGKKVNISQCKRFLEVLSVLLAQWRNLEKTPDHPRLACCEDQIRHMVREFLPSGSGFDGGTQFNQAKSTPDKLVFETEYHHMNEGFYDGWSKHTITVKPSFGGFHMTISGKNRNDIKDYIGQVFDCALRDVAIVRTIEGTYHYTLPCDVEDGIVDAKERQGFRPS